MIDRHFGKWTVVKRAAKRRQWVCCCECGVVRSVHESNLRSGASRSCGGPGHPRPPPKIKHGHTANGIASREYRSWTQMLVRCGNPRAPNFSTYGGAGIHVCAAWRDSFEAFLCDMGPRPEGTTLDRRDNRKGYTPANCRWATPAEQAVNRGTTHWLTFNGETKTLTAWARLIGISDTGLLARVRLGQSPPHILRPSRRPRFEVTP